MGNDRVTIRIVAAVLGIVSVCIAIGGLLLAWADKDVPDPVVAMGSVALGALAALLASVRADI